MGEDRYAEVLAKQDSSPTLHRLYLLTFGDEYPQDVAPFGFVTRTDLARMAELLAVTEGEVFADFGCGRGGPGLWLARATGASLIGLDILPAAVAEAERRKADFVPAGLAAFRVAGFLDNGLADEELDAAVSVDALWMVADKARALAEVARTLKPGARLVMTTWEPPSVNHAELLAQAGLTVLLRAETPAWLSRQMAFYEGVLAAAGLLRRELGAAASRVLVEEARHTRAALPNSPRLLIVASR
jgi:SAM-dependent methyltransferase